MFLIKYVQTFPLTRRIAAPVLSRGVATGPGGSSSEDEIHTARRWLSDFDLDTVPRSICEVTFSRSSGPGGQNVNKVNSKATLKVSTASVFRLIPPILHPAIRQSRYYNIASDSITIQSDDSRKQGDNVQRCFMKLHDLIVEAGVKTIPGKTTDDQRKRVQSYQKAANENRLKAKKLQSSKKSDRKDGGRSGSSVY